MRRLNPMFRMPPLLIAVALAPACDRPDSTPGEAGTITSSISTSPPNRVVNGPAPGCADAFEIVNQALAIPDVQITLDAGGIVDRAGVVTTGATYTFATRPVNPLDCGSTELPASPAQTVTFGFNYLGDFSRMSPLCINGSSLDLTSFSVTGTPLDALVEPTAREVIWLEVDREVASRLHPLMVEGAYPPNANPRCQGWVDLSTLPPPAS